MAMAPSFASNPPLFDVPNTISGIHSNLPNIMHVATKVHVILRRFIVLTRMHDNRELV